MIISDCIYDHDGDCSSQHNDHQYNHDKNHDDHQIYDDDNDGSSQHRKRQWRQDSTRPGSWSQPPLGCSAPLFGVVILIVIVIVFLLL